MPDVLLFGATGYTGRLTAQALARREARFAIAGRDPAKLEALAAEVDAEETHVVEVGDVDGLTKALSGARVLVTCVGPFTQLGQTAVDAALRAEVNYLDSTGEAAFVRALLARDAEARAARIAMAPAMGFDDVPADVAATLSTEGLRPADLVVTYAFPRAASYGTLRTILTNILGSDGQWIEDGRPVRVRSGHEHRWAPMPPPLGPRRTTAFSVAEALLAPLHLDLQSLRTFVTSGTTEQLAARFGGPLLRLALSPPPARAVLERLLPTGRGPDAATRSRSRWMILAEARAGEEWRNVALRGTDVYGLTAETLAAGSMKMAEDGYAVTGVVAPVQAVGLETLQKVLIDNGVGIETYTYE